MEELEDVTDWSRMMDQACRNRERGCSERGMVVSRMLLGCKGAVKTGLRTL